MNFTREPIIETIITPREGFKLLVRSSKSSSQEEFQVDAVEVIGFGHSFFFRSTEKPRPFMVPVGDYEIIEVKEARVILKSGSLDKAVKIGGGRDAGKKAPVEVSAEESIGEVASVEEEVAETVVPVSSDLPRHDRRKDRRRNRRRRHQEDRTDLTRETSSRNESAVEEGAALGEDVARGGNGGLKVPSAPFPHLIPPPPTLISETISRYKDLVFSEPSGSSKALGDNPAHYGFEGDTEMQGEPPVRGEEPTSTDLSKTDPHLL